MISREENERLCLIHPGAPMGDVFRSYWLPFALLEELPDPDGAPIRVRLLGEDLVAFRDTTGKVGLVDAHCPHRCAPLYFGRNEGSGIRCVYHGWKFDVDGKCLEIPSEPEFSHMKDHVSLRSYPTWEGGGALWAYLGPKEQMPDYPDYEWLRAPEEQRGICKTLQACNWLQALEGGIDTVHSSFLHIKDINGSSALRARDKHPQLDVEITDYGFRYASIRNIGGNERYVRVNEFVMPCQNRLGGTLDLDGLPARQPRIHGFFWVPIDDTTTAVYFWLYSADPDDPIDQTFWRRHITKQGRGPNDNIPGTYWPKQNMANDYLIDRWVQKHKTFTGIPNGISAEDYAVQEGMGPIVDRTREFPGSSDGAILTARQLLLEAADAVAEGRAPRGSDPNTYRSFRPAEKVMTTDESWREALEKDFAARW